MSNTFLCVGLMSGTSMDGIDAALVETNGDDMVKELGHIAIPYQEHFKHLLKATQHCIKTCAGDMEKARHFFSQGGLRHYLITRLKVSELAVNDILEGCASYMQSCGYAKETPLSLDHIIQHSTELHATAVNQLLAQQGRTATDIDVVGYHGQTMLHQPDKDGQPNKGLSIMVGDGQLLANRLGISVVTNFRARDVAAGGKGAPFAPILHQALVLQSQIPLPAVVVNCGGISNISLIRDRQRENLIGFDTGPGNYLLDSFVASQTQGRESFDQDGQYGKMGHINEAVLNALREKSTILNNQNYYDVLPPKALDTADFKLLGEVLQLLADDLQDVSLLALDLNDGCATLAQFTADTIVSSLDLLNLKKEDYPTTWILAGGGWYNPTILTALKSLLAIKDLNIVVKTASELGWTNQAIEAQIFAYFAVRSLQNEPLSVPLTTGVPTPLSGGHAYIPPAGATHKVQQLIDENPAVLTGYMSTTEDICSTLVY